MKHFKYLSYVVRHKWFVFVECCKVGLFWRGLVHDLSKFNPSEWFTYVEYFYGGPHRPFSSYSCGEKYMFLEWISRNCKESVDERFDRAWLLHQHRNPHHWQFWVLREDDGGIKAMAMPAKYLHEMVCDWRGAGRAINGKDDTLTWYMKNRHKMQLHKNTRAEVERMLCVPEVDRWQESDNAI